MPYAWAASPPTLRAHSTAITSRQRLRYFWRVLTRGDRPRCAIARPAPVLSALARRSAKTMDGPVALLAHDGAAACCPRRSRSASTAPPTCKRRANRRPFRYAVPSPVDTNGIAGAHEMRAAGEYHGATATRQACGSVVDGCRWTSHAAGQQPRAALPAPPRSYMALGEGASSPAVYSEFFGLVLYCTSISHRGDRTLHAAALMQSRRQQRRPAPWRARACALTPNRSLARRGGRVHCSGRCITTGRTRRDRIAHHRAARRCAFAASRACRLLRRGLDAADCGRHICAWSTSSGLLLR